VFRLGRFFRVGHIIVCVFSKGKQTHAWAFITYEYARKFSNSNSKTLGENNFRETKALYFVPFF